MATELKPGMFLKLAAEINAEAQIRSRKALTELALVVEKQAKLNASSGTHKYGTKTPAHPGTGPAIISGNLRRSITHTPIKEVGLALETLVGTGIGFPAPYGSHTPANKYGFYLETGLKNGTTYPFLGPALKFAVGVPAALIYAKNFGTGWKKVF